MVMGASSCWVVNARRVFTVFALATLASTSGAEDHHAPRHQRRSLQSSSSIVFINAITGTPFTSAEEDAVQLQVRVCTYIFSSVFVLLFADSSVFGDANVPASTRPTCQRNPRLNSFPPFLEDGRLSPSARCIFLESALPAVRSSVLGNATCLLSTKHIGIEERRARHTWGCGDNYHYLFHRQGANFIRSVGTVNNYLVSCNWYHKVLHMMPLQAMFLMRLACCN